MTVTSQFARSHPRQTSPLAQALREATASDHHALDHHELLAPLLRPGLDLTVYIQILKTFLWLYRTLDVRLETAAERLGWQPSRFALSPRLNWLEQDLSILDPHGQCGPLPSVFWAFPPLDSAAEWVGEVYVVEGSTLGGQVITRLVHDQLGLTPDTGGRFFFGHGEQTLERWQAFFQFAETQVTEPEYAACCSSAQRLFADFHSGFSSALTHWQQIGPIVRSLK